MGTCCSSTALPPKENMDGVLSPLPASAAAQEASAVNPRYDELAALIGPDVADQVRDKLDCCISQAQIQEELAKIQNSDKFSPEAKDFATEAMVKITDEKQLPLYLNPYEDEASLNAAIVGGARAATALIKASFLLNLLANGGTISARQHLPEEAIFTGRISDKVLVLALSYCWADRMHPDPRREVLRDVCLLLRYLEASRYWGDELPEARDNYNIHDREIVIFWDFMSLYQNEAPWPASPEEPRGDTRTADQVASFSNGLKNVNLWYVHSQAYVILATHAYRQLAYLKSGWPVFERLTAMLLKNANYALDLPIFIEWMEEKLGLDMEKVMDDEAFKDNASIYWMFERNRRAARQLPLVPRVFDQQVQTLIFSNGSDRGFVRQKYESMFNDVITQATKFELGNLQGATAADWADFLRHVLPLCPDLVHVDLSRNEAIGGEGAGKSHTRGEGCVCVCEERETWKERGNEARLIHDDSLLHSWPHDAPLTPHLTPAPLCMSGVLL